jgi:hypothetical protein
MNDQFDELAKGLAQSVTRRGALKKFGLGLAGIAVATLGLVNKVAANPVCLPSGYACKNPDNPNNKCCSGFCRSTALTGRKQYGICS